LREFLHSNVFWEGKIYLNVQKFVLKGTRINSGLYLGSLINESMVFFLKRKKEELG